MVPYPPGFMRVYFETSAINAFAKKHSIADAIATKAFQKARGRMWCISPITIWEILLTEDEHHKEDLIILCQHLFHEDLLPSPEELVVEFIKQGCPLAEKPRRLVSKTALAAVWKDICTDKRKTFVYDKQELRRRVDFFVPLTRLVRRVVKSQNAVLLPDDETVGTDLTLEGLLKSLSFVRKAKRISTEQRKLWKLAILYIMFVLCAEASFNNEITKEFWGKIGIDTTLDRILYILRNYEILVHRGPFLEMAIMTLRQSKHRFSRGVLFDSLHSLYLPFVDLFLTNDNHFVRMREDIGHHPNAYKIFKMTELEWVYHQRAS